MSSFNSTLYGLMHGDSARDIIPAPNSQVMWLCGLGAHENLRHTRLPGIECTGLRIYVDHRVITTVITVHSIYTIIMLCFRNSLVFTMFPNHKPSIRNTKSNQFLDQRLFFRWPMPCNKSSPNGLPCTGSFATWKRKTSLGDWGASTPNMKACNHDLP